MIRKFTEESFVVVSAHFNLNDEYLPYKYIIGQVILDVCAHIHARFVQGLMNVVQKNKNVKTVVNKLNSIDAKFRFFKMELLAGEPNYLVEHVGFGVLPSVIMSANTKPGRSTSRTACLRSTSQRFTGTPDYTPSTTGSFSCLAQMMSLWTCLPGSDPSPFQRRRKDVGYLRMI